MSLENGFLRSRLGIIVARAVCPSFDTIDWAQDKAGKAWNLDSVQYNNATNDGDQKYSESVRLYHEKYCYTGLADNCKETVKYSGTV